jgi:predicted AlkP superfamily phosphohydrolase/phosphomutase
MVQFQNLDPFQHRAWRYLNVDETGVDAPEWNSAAAEVLAGLDRAIGLLIELADRRNAAILVCSDHGFGPCLGRIHANRILIDAGVARLPSASGKIAQNLGKVVDRLKVWNEKRSDRSARSSSFDSSVAAQFPFDWKRTLAFAPHQDTAAMVYLNTASRHSGAPLETPRQIDDARSSASSALACARHPISGKRLFPRVIDTASEYGVDPVSLGYPDLIALPDESYWVRTKLSSGSAWVEPDDNLPGTHRPEGVISLCVPGISPGRTLSADLRDVTPTILSLLDEPIPSHVEGRPLPCVSSTPARADRLDRPSSDIIPAPHASSFEYTAEEQAIIEQRLADLGYLE